MKLRIQESNITLRLLADEIEELATAKTLNQATQLPGGKVEIRVAVKEILDMEFSFENQVYSFSIPANQVENWSTTNKIGFKHNYDDLLVVVEKDLSKRKK